ncbi:MAG: DUF4838 domain-containing protein [Lentisphaeria bacterium]|nr:DUF4838 domain-containing protein [Lentisphaeria bacterium]
MKRFLTTFLFAALISAAAGAEYAKNLNYRIIIPDKASAIEKAAAAELKLHLAKSFTKAVKLNGKVPALISFYVGNVEKSPFAGVRSKGEFTIFRKGENFLLTGADTPNGNITRLTDDCGTFHSAAYFAQKYLKVKIFMPGAQGIKYASNPEIIFSGAEDSPVPSYSVRGFQSAGKGVAKDEALLYFRRRLGSVPRWTRSNYYYKFLNNWNKRFKDRPELFAMHEGRRVNENYPRHFPCTSNPAVLDQVEKDMAEALKKRPYIYSVRFFSDAPVRSCSCDRCRNSAVGKLVTPDDHSETVYAFFCQIARRVLKHKQGLYFHIQTKGTVYCNVPKTEKLPPNTVISVLTGHFLPQDYNKMRALCDSWRKAGAKVLVYTYPRAPEMRDYPLMNPHRIAEYYKNFKGAAEGSNFAEGRSKVPYSFSALNTYIHSAVMFDTSVDADKLIDEFCSLAAPKCSAELKKFYTAMEKLLEGAGFRDDPRFNCYAFERLAAPRELLKKTLAKDPANPFLKQLSADFENFVGVVAKTAVAVKKYNEMLKAHDAAAAKRKLVKLSEKAVSFPLVPMKVCENFQESLASISQVKENFKFKVFCKENQISHIDVRCTENHTGVIWGDDTAELFFSAPGASYPYIHIAINAKGIYRVQLNSAPKVSEELHSFNFRTAGKIGKDGWSVEGEIPLKQLSAVLKGKKTDLAVTRSRTVTGKRQAQLSSVQRTAAAGFHDPGNRFTVEFR